MLHWNGRGWRRVATPNPGNSGYGEELLAVAGTSCSNLWAVGDYSGNNLHDAEITRSITARCQRPG
jgi:hypothetical protein